MEMGDAMKLLLAGAFISRPRFLIVDEPFAGLDVHERRHCMAILRKIRERGAGILVTDHDPAALLELADVVHIIRDGAIVYSDSAEAARTSTEARRLYFRKRA